MSSGIVWCFSALLAAAPIQYSDSSGNLHLCRDDSLIVGLAAPPGGALFGDRASEGLHLRLSRCGGSVAAECSQGSVVLLQLRAGEDAAEVRRNLLALPEVRYVEPNWIGEGGYVPDDPHFNDQWHHQQAGDHDIDSVEAWEISRGSSEVVVAVLDSGIDLSHPEFEGRLLPGWDFVHGDAVPEMEHQHGTQVAGLLAANADNMCGVAGVDHRCLILPVKVLDKNNLGDLFLLVQGIYFAADQGADVINMSLINFGESNALKEALTYARDEKGAVLVACSGNLGIGNADVSWPGASPLCLTVGFTNATDGVDLLSGSGNALDVVAPGKQTATVGISPNACGFSLFSGCSAATPIVSGIASLLRSVKSDLTHTEVQDLIQRGAQDRVGGDADLPGWDPFYGWGRVNALNSLSLLISDTKFIRGDASPDKAIDISDAVHTINFLVGGGPAAGCLDAADANDDGVIDITDPVSVLNYLFLGGLITQPFPGCGPDLQQDSLGCGAGC